MKNNKSIVIMCFLTTLLIYGSSGAYTPYISSYYQLSGLDKLQIGLISCVGPIVAILVQPIWGIVSDKTGKRKRILQILSLCSSITMVLYFVSAKPLFLVLCSFLYTSFSMAIIPLANAIITNASKMFGFDYAHVRIGGPIGYSTVPLLISSLIIVYPKCMFIFSMVLYLGLFGMITFLPNKIFVMEQKKQEIKSEHQLFDSNEVVFVFGLAVLNMIGGSIINTYLGPQILDIGYSQATIGKLTFVMSVCELPVLLFIKKFTVRFNSVNLMGFTVTIATIRLFLASSNKIGMIILCQILEGLTYMVSFYTCVTYISSHSTQGNESKAQTLLVLLESGIGAIFANVVGGYLMKTLGTVVGFKIVGGFLIVGMTVLLLIRQKLNVTSNDNGK